MQRTQETESETEEEDEEQKGEEDPKLVSSQYYTWSTDTASDDECTSQDSNWTQVGKETESETTEGEDEVVEEGIADDQDDGNVK